MSDAYEYVGDKWQRRMQQPCPPTWKKTTNLGPFGGSWKSSTILRMEKIQKQGLTPQKKTLIFF